MHPPKLMPHHNGVQPLTPADSPACMTLRYRGSRYSTCLIVRLFSTPRYILFAELCPREQSTLCRGFAVTYLYLRVSTQHIRLQ